MTQLGRYPSYRPTGWDWSREVPSHWEFLPIRRIGRVVNGGTPGADESHWGGEIPFMTPPDLRLAEGGEVLTTERTLTRAGVDEGSSTAPAASVVVSIRAPIGYVGRTIQETAFNQGCRAVVVHTRSDPRYVAYSVIAARSELNAQGRGTTFMEVSGGQFLALPLPLPPTEEQWEIANYLDEHTLRIDTLVEKQAELIRTLRERRGVVEAKVLEAGARHEKLAWRAQISSGDALDIAQISRDRTGERIVPVIGGNGVMGFSATSNVVGRTIAVGRVGALCGNVHIIEGPAWITDNALRVDLTGMFELDFVALILRALQLNSISRSTAQPLITGGQIGGLRLPCPPTVEQKAIVASTLEKTSRIDTLISKTVEHILLAKERRAALIAAAVTGQIDVRTAGRAADGVA